MNYFVVGEPILFIRKICLLFAISLLTPLCNAVATEFDLDGDNKADIVMRDAASGEWSFLSSVTGFSVVERLKRFGLQPTDIPVLADYDGDGLDDIAIRRPSTGEWFISHSSNPEQNGILKLRFGLDINDVPVKGDFDGDGKSDVAIFRKSTGTWFVLNSSGSNFHSNLRDGIQRFRFGIEKGDIPVPADYDGDGITDFAIRRPQNYRWYIVYSSKSKERSLADSTVNTFRFGLEEADIPIPADYDGDGIADIAVRRPQSGMWYIKNSSGSNYNSTQRDGIQRLKFGQLASDIVLAADFDGDGISDPSVVRRSSDTAYFLSTKSKEVVQIPLSINSTSFLASGSNLVINAGLKIAVTQVTNPPNVIVIYTDDQGYADLGVQNQLTDIKTPNIDRLANNGVRFTNGYVTAPQCTPSRAAMVTGQYQERFGVEENVFTPIPKGVKTLGDRFQSLGYKTGLVGKWHLEIDNNSKEWGAINHPEILPFNANKVPLSEKREYFPDKRGYDDTFFGFDLRYWTNFDLKGQSKKAGYRNYNMYRLDAITQAAIGFIDKNWQSPFYLHVAHYGPHVPLSATEEYLSRFPGDMPERRRYALAMISAIDDGVGKIIDKLAKYDILKNTIIYFISDNGAPLDDTMPDKPIQIRGIWDGSRNDPLTGEKGMLTEAGIRVPYIVSWQGHFQSGSVISKPVSALDAAYTALKLAGETDLSELDGVDLFPTLTGNENPVLSSRPLFWKFYNQRAVREGRWKYLQAGIKREYLFDIENDPTEKINLISLYPDVAKSLQHKYWQWSSNMLRRETLKEIEIPFQRRYDDYLPFYQ
ncbi:sulfatase-like hydrolase/transferase [Neptunicella marina]|uniref:Sulfatase-like hydrolase/transferase n=1 Tax=Neptunicella marina TaxID=2125989 RepID=A0A8J6ISI7_9ALTE|nr:sulfatase-like hydrolase/transferase [Neptunicella marina]MBC3764922.1 sulfatase-like hydrolase/transferase [Neptunicella marina]